MATSPHLAQKIRDTFGNEAGTELTGILDKVATDIAGLRDSISDLRGDMAELRHQTEMGFSRMEKVISDSRADLIKWSFVFWVGAVAAIAALAGVLRH